jgi:hypothetical protein
MGAGGGSGAYSAVFIQSPDSSYSYVIGQGGTGVSGAPGNSGGDTTFGTVLKAEGGKAYGSVMAAGTSVAGLGPAAGGLASNGIGDIKLDGSSGWFCTRVSGTTPIQGNGAPSVWSGSSPNNSANVNGSDGLLYGGGGTGAYTVSAFTRTGGAGYQGAIRVTEYFDSGSAAILAGGLPTGGTANQLLKKNSGTNYDATWITDLSTATFQTSAASYPTGTTSTIGVMMGLAYAFTPIRSGKVLLYVGGFQFNNTANGKAQTQMHWGTGTAPTNGVALTGTAVGPINASQFTSGFVTSPFSFVAIVTGLTLNTAIWFDIELGLNGLATGTANAQGIMGTAFELP